MSTTFLKYNVSRDHTSPEEQHRDESVRTADGLVVKSESFIVFCRQQQGFKSNAARSQRRKRSSSMREFRKNKDRLSRCF